MTPELEKEIEEAYQKHAQKCLPGVSLTDLSRYRFEAGYRAAIEKMEKRDIEFNEAITELENNNAIPLMDFMNRIETKKGE